MVRSALPRSALSATYPRVWLPVQERNREGDHRGHQPPRADSPRGPPDQGEMLGEIDELIQRRNRALNEHCQQQESGQSTKKRPKAVPTRHHSRRTES